MKDKKIITRPAKSYYARKETFFNPLDANKVLVLLGVIVLILSLLGLYFLPFEGN